MLKRLQKIFSVLFYMQPPPEHFCKCFANVLFTCNLGLTLAASARTDSVQPLRCRTSKHYGRSADLPGRNSSIRHRRGFTAPSSFRQLVYAADPTHSSPRSRRSRSPSRHSTGLGHLLFVTGDAVEHLKTHFFRVSFD